MSIIFLNLKVIVHYNICIDILQLFNLLGFTRLTLIETLLKFRKDILKQCLVTNEKKNIHATDLSTEV